MKICNLNFSAEACTFLHVTQSWNTKRIQAKKCTHGNSKLNQVCTDTANAPLTQQWHPSAAPTPREHTGLFEGKGGAGETYLPPFITVTHADQTLHSPDVYCYLSVYLAILLLLWLYYTHVTEQRLSQAKILWNFNRFKIWKFLGCQFYRLGSVCDLEQK